MFWNDNHGRRQIVALVYVLHLL